MSQDEVILGHTHMEVDVVQRNGETIRTRRRIVNFVPHPGMPEMSFRVPTPELFEGEEVHYVFGVMTPMILQGVR